MTPPGEARRKAHEDAREHRAALREALRAGLLADGECCVGDGLAFAADGCCREPHGARSEPGRRATLQEREDR